MRCCNRNYGYDPNCQVIHAKEAALQVSRGQACGRLVDFNLGADLLDSGCLFFELHRQASNFPLLLRADHFEVPPEL